MFLTGLHMSQIGKSEAYIQGMKAKVYTNPYERGSQQHNDFERGWSQRIKRGGSYQSLFFMDDFSATSKPTLKEIHSPKKLEKPNLCKYDSYASAKGK